MTTICQCVYCDQFRPDGAGARYIIEVLETCNAPDGDGHVWQAIDPAKISLNYTMRDFSRMSEKRIHQIQRMLGVFLDTPREKEARGINTLIREYLGQRYGW